MKSSEEQASHITEILLGTGTLGDLFSNLFVIAVLPAIGEELFFRGIVQKQFQELANNRTAAIVLTSVLFSALHMQFLDLFHGSYWACSLASSMHGADPSGYR